MACSLAAPDDGGGDGGETSAAAAEAEEAPRFSAGPTTLDGTAPDVALLAIPLRPLVPALDTPGAGNS